MKAKRIIKGFIYFFPFMILIMNALCFFIPTVRFNTLYDVSYPSGTLDGNDVSQMVNTHRTFGFSDFTYPIIQAYNFINSDDTPLYDSYRVLLDDIGIHADDTGEALDFFAILLTYETYAILICAVLDVIFLIPEFYNKIEDKYIKGGKKRE